MDLRDIFNVYMNNSPRDGLLSIYERCMDNASPEEMFELLDTAVRYADTDAVSKIIGTGYRADTEHLFTLASISKISHRPKDGDVYKVAALLIDGKASPLKKDESGNTCYHIAARRGNGEFVKALLDKNIRLTASDSEDNSGLHLVCEYCYNSIEGVESSKKRLKEAKERNDKNIASWERNVTNAKADLEGYFIAAKAFLDAGVDIDQLNRMNEKALTLAIRKGAKKIASLITGDYAEGDDDAVLAGGMTLHQAVLMNDPEAVAAIIGTGADVNGFSDEENLKGMSPLGVACAFIHLDMVKILLDNGADVHLKDSYGVSPIMCVFTNTTRNMYKSYGKTVREMMTAMIEKGLDVNAAVDDNGNTLLTVACNYRDDDISAAVLDVSLSAGADVNTPNDKGQTPLMLISSTSHKETENMYLALLENGADVNKKDEYGNTALMYISYNNNARMAKDLADMLFDAGDVLPGSVNTDGKTALDYAVQNNNEPLVKLLLQKKR